VACPLYWSEFDVTDPTLSPSALDEEGGIAAQMMMALERPSRLVDTDFLSWKSERHQNRPSF